MYPDVLEHFAFCHHASWRQARRIGQELGVALNAQGLKGFVPEERKEDAPYLRGRDTALLKRDAINVLCLSIAYNFFPHIKQNLLAAAAIPTS
ncbi:MAG: hypothetical protein DCC75_11855 [Proteobacteria bacterium]|nr:MAG: hypothetical protein DCC75_11855 [Pseudomonadota bacterium]